MSASQTNPTRTAVTYGFTTVAGALLGTLGVFQALAGISAIAKDDVFAVTDDYVYKFDLTTWGWIHLILGALAVLIGVCLLLGQTWARVAGIALAILSAISQFLWLPYQRCGRSSSSPSTSP